MGRKRDDKRKIVGEHWRLRRNRNIEAEVLVELFLLSMANSDWLFIYTSEGAVSRGMIVLIGPFLVSGKSRWRFLLWGGVYIHSPVLSLVP